MSALFDDYERWGNRARRNLRSIRGRLAIAGTVAYPALEQTAERWYARSGGATCSRAWGIDRFAKRVVHDE